MINHVASNINIFFCISYLDSAMPIFFNFSNMSISDSRLKKLNINYRKAKGRDQVHRSRWGRWNNFPGRKEEADSSPGRPPRIHCPVSGRCYSYTGLLPEENVLGQWFEVDLTLWLDLSTSATSDDIKDTIDYRQGIAIVKDVIKNSQFALVEKLTEIIAQRLLTLDGMTKVRVRLSKVAPPIPDFGGSIVIDITRSK